MSPTQTTARPCTAWPKDALRIGFGLIWLIDAALKWLPGFRASYMDTIMGEAGGQPGWLRPWFHFWITVQHPDAAAFGWLVAVVETLIAVALITGFARKLTYIAAIVFSVLIWGTAEGFGGRTPPAPPTSAPPSSTRSSSPGCWPSATTPARPGTPPTTTWSRSTAGGGSSPNCAAPPRLRSRP